MHEILQLSYVHIGFKGTHTRTDLQIGDDLVELKVCVPCDFALRFPEAIGDLRGRGLLLGVEIVMDRDSKTPDKEYLARLSQRCFELGLNLNRVGGPLAVWRIAPPLTISKAEVDLSLEIMDEAFSTTV